MEAYLSITDPGNKPTEEEVKRALKVLGIIFAVIVCFIVVTAVISMIGNSANMKKARSFPQLQAVADRIVLVPNGIRLEK